MNFERARFEFAALKTAVKDLFRFAPNGMERGELPFFFKNNIKNEVH